MTVEVEQMTVAYSPPRNLGNIISPRNLHLSSGLPVSSYRKWYRRRPRERERERVFLGYAPLRRFTPMTLSPHPPYIFFWNYQCLKKYYFCTVLGVHMYPWLITRTATTYAQNIIYFYPICMLRVTDSMNNIYWNYTYFATIFLILTYPVDRSQYCLSLHF